MTMTENRRYRRVSAELPADVTINTTTRHACTVLNISPGDLFLQGKLDAVIGDAVVIRIHGLDVIEGSVARVLPDGVAVSYILSKKRQTNLIEKLTIQANKSFSKGLDDRRSSLRHRQTGKHTVCRLEDGTSLFAKIIDVSPESMSLDVGRRPELGSVIHVGRERGTVVRHTPRGFIFVLDAEQGSEQTEDKLKAI